MDAFHALYYVAERPALFGYSADTIEPTTRETQGRVLSTLQRAANSLPEKEIFMTRRVVLVVLSAALVSGSIACSQNPNPVLTPAAQLASANGRVVHALDVIRDAALIFVNPQGTGQLPIPIARRLVVTHRDALKILDARGDNYVRVIQASLVAVMDQLPPPLNLTLAPYFALASTLVDVLSNREIDLQLSAETIAAYERARDASLAFDASWLASH